MGGDRSKSMDFYLKFKHKLLQHPDEVLREMKLKMPGNVRLNIVENTQDVLLGFAGKTCGESF